MILSDSFDLKAIVLLLLPAGQILLTIAYDEINLDIKVT